MPKINYKRNSLDSFRFPGAQKFSSIPPVSSISPRFPLPSVKKNEKINSYLSVFSLHIENFCPSLRFEGEAFIVVSGAVARGMRASLQSLSGRDWELGYLIARKIQFVDFSDNF